MKREIMKKLRNIILAIAIVGSVFAITACGNKTKTDYMVLVNKKSKLSKDWEKKIEIKD